MNGTEGRYERHLRVILFEHHALLREALRALLESASNVNVVGHVGDATDALAAIETLAPSVVITDIDLPDESGINLIAAIRQRGYDVPIIVLTALSTEENLRAAMLAGANGFVLKDSSLIELVEGLNAVIAGRRFFCKTLSTGILRRLQLVVKAPEEQTPLQLMTRREREVLTRVALGQSNKFAARSLGLSVKTVEKHRSNLMRKLDLHNSAELTMFALRHGLVRAEANKPAPQSRPST